MLSAKMNTLIIRSLINNCLYNYIRYALLVMETRTSTVNFIRFISYTICQYYLINTFIYIAQHPANTACSMHIITKILLLWHTITPYTKYIELQLISHCNYVCNIFILF